MTADAIDYTKWTLNQLIAAAREALGPERLQYLREMEADHPTPPRKRRGKPTALEAALRAAVEAERAALRACRRGQAGRGALALALALTDSLRGLLGPPWGVDGAEAPARRKKAKAKDSPGQAVIEWPG